MTQQLISKLIFYLFSYVHKNLKMHKNPRLFKYLFTYYYGNKN